MISISIAEWAILHYSHVIYWIIHFFDIKLNYLYRWANQGLDFLTVACDPKTLKTLSESAFQVWIENTYFLHIRYLVSLPKIKEASSWSVVLAVCCVEFVKWKYSNSADFFPWKELKKAINGCICHVIGSAESCSGATSAGTHSLNNLLSLIDNNYSLKDCNQGKPKSRTPVMTSFVYS